MGVIPQITDPQPQITDPQSNLLNVASYSESRGLRLLVAAEGSPGSGEAGGMNRKMG